VIPAQRCVTRTDFEWQCKLRTRLSRQRRRLAASPVGHQNAQKMARTLNKQLSELGVTCFADPGGALRSRLRVGRFAGSRVLPGHYDD